MWLTIGCISSILVVAQVVIAYRSVGKKCYWVMLSFPLLCLLIYTSFQLHFVILPKEGCRYNLKQINDVLTLYASEHENCLPDSLLSGHNIDVKELSLLYIISDYQIFRCPQDKENNTSVRYSSYWYTSMVFTQEEDFLNCVNGAGSGDNAKQSKKRLCRGVFADENEIPVLIEIPRNTMWHGCHVLFLDGHIECITPGEKWPLTKGIVLRLKELFVPTSHRETG